MNKKASASFCSKKLITEIFKVVNLDKISYILYIIYIIIYIIYTYIYIIVYYIIYYIYYYIIYYVSLYIYIYIICDNSWELTYRISCLVDTDSSYSETNSAYHHDDIRICPGNDWSSNYIYQTRKVKGHLPTIFIS